MSSHWFNFFTLFNDQRLHIRIVVEGACMFDMCLFRHTGMRRSVLLPVADVAVMQVTPNGHGKGNVIGVYA